MQFSKLLQIVLKISRYTWRIINIYQVTRALKHTLKRSKETAISRPTKMNTLTALLIFITCTLVTEKTYSYEVYEALPAGGGMMNTYFDIEEINRQIKIKRFTWTARLSIPATNTGIPIINHPNQYFLVGVGIPANNTFKEVVNIFNTLITLNNGDRFYSYEPGQYFINSSFVENSIRIGCIVNNFDAVNIVGVRINFLIETEEKIIYI